MVALKSSSVRFEEVMRAWCFVERAMDFSEADLRERDFMFMDPER